MNGDDRARQINQVAANLRGLMAGAFQSRDGSDASVGGPVIPIEQCWPCDAFSAGGRIPAAGPKGNLTTNVIEQNFFEWKANPELCKYGDPTVAATINVRLSSNPEAQGQGDASNFDYTDAFLRILFGSDNRGPEAVVDVDLVNSTSVPLVGRRIRFALIYPLVTLSVQQGGPIVQPLIDVSVSVGIESGNAAGSRGAQRTIKTGDVDANQTSAILPIPPFAASAVFASSDATAQATMNQTRSPAAGAATIGKFITWGKLQAQSVPIMNGARGFSISAGGGNITNGQAIFYLATA